jgi:hypothetical protein
LVNVNRGKDATYEMVKAMSEASPHWLSKFQTSIGNHAQGNGTTIAIGLAIISLVVAIGVWTQMRWPALTVGIVVSLAYWVFGQSLGGPFWIGNATDVNAAPLFVLLAVALFPIRQVARAERRAPSEDPAQVGIPGVT